MKTDRTLEQIRQDGLTALRQCLGVAGMVRFLQQFEHGSGDYVADSRKWARTTTLDDIRAMAAKARNRRRRKAG